MAVTRSHICQRVQSYTSALADPPHPPPASSTPTLPLPSSVPSSTRQQLMLAGHSRVCTGLNRQPSVPLAHCWHTANWQHTQPKTQSTPTNQPTNRCHTHTSLQLLPHMRTHTGLKARICIQQHTHRTAARRITRLQSRHSGGKFTEEKLHGAKNKNKTIWSDHYLSWSHTFTHFLSLVWFSSQYICLMHPYLLQSVMTDVSRCGFKNAQAK